VDLFALLLGFIAGLAVVGLVVVIWRLLRRTTKTAAAHTETSSAQAPRPADQPSVVAAPPPVGPPSPPADATAAVQPAPAVARPARPVAALMTYSKVNGSTSVRDLTIYSRNLRDGQIHSPPAGLLAQPLQADLKAHGIHPPVDAILLCQGLRIPHEQDRRTQHKTVAKGI
jgi:hypothetical protein